MRAVLDILLFGGAAFTAIGTIVATVVPQYDRIVRLLGTVDPHAPRVSR